MNPTWAFALVAALMVAAALRLALPADGGGPVVQRSRLGLLMGLPLAATALYLALGDPAAMNPARVALSARLQGQAPAAGEATLGDEDLRAELTRHLQRQPHDARAWVLKARLDLQTQHYSDAAAAFAHATDNSAKAARDASVWADHAEAVALAQDGRLGGPPEALIAKALALQADHPKALDLAASAALEKRDYASAARHWRLLLAQMPPGTARHNELATAVAAAEQRAALVAPAAATRP